MRQKLEAGGIFPLKLERPVSGVENRQATFVSTKTSHFIS